MDLSFFVVQLLSGLTMATFLFLIASGLTLIFGVGKVFNFAHGSFFMLGAYAGYQLSSVWGQSFWLSLVAGGIFAGVLGMLAEFLFLRRIYGRADEGGFQILLTYSFILIIDDLVKLVWGTEYKSLAKPAVLQGAFSFSGIVIPRYNVAVILIGLAVVVAAWWFLNRTRAGRIARASALDREMLAVLGVNVPMTMTLVFGIATALAGMTGVLAAPLRSVTPGAGIEVIIDSLIVVVLGGLGNFWGAWLAALLLGEVNSFAVVFVPKWATLFSYLVMALTLLFKPEGLFAPRKVRRV
ncbi:High-affinity branched-chain amino acid transport system permease protein LivH [Fundidesulfovibrio magnetotacticus]|uniref:High-affinity branched-chain amino acid transport system permease protein LivH n=1 Tax=Fundidesulfovibrio magnetotacticus TaxID=2730080 RepID=A0A6V8LUU9_9BACT|nr:branched-chain amino acid ABC transporter permease [Fundidesulfovibrio magnetotacticus]GFK93437.1 High-affinity branched-chain amino acid transport system permease protein LivH [Fundidesulfovibrio magnetotacticus]